MDDNNTPLTKDIEKFYMFILDTITLTRLYIKIIICCQRITFVIKRNWTCIFAQKDNNRKYRKVI